MFVSKIPMRVTRTARVTVGTTPVVIDGAGCGVLIKVVSGTLLVEALGGTPGAASYPLAAGDTLDCTGLAAVRSGDADAVAAVLYYDSL